MDNEQLPRPSGRLLRDATALPWAQQLQRFHLQEGGDALHVLEGEVALPALEPTDVGAMESKKGGERLLTDSLGISIGAQISAYDPLELAFHPGNAPRLLLDRLQTYE